MKNPYFHRSRLSAAKFREILYLFCVDVEASKAAQISRVSRPTVNALYAALRVRLAEICEETAAQLPRGVVCELDESYFGPRRLHGKRGRGADGKTAVFGILARGGRVYTRIVPNCSSAVILPIIRRFVPLESIINTDGFGAYERLVTMGYKRHQRVKHSAGELAKPGGNHINGIENFWGICKTRLSRFRGLRPDMFYYHLKECEFRYNMRHADIYQFLLKNLRKQPLQYNK